MTATAQTGTATTGMGGSPGGTVSSSGPSGRLPRSGRLSTHTCVLLYLIGCNLPQNAV